MPGYAWDEANREEVTGARLNDQNVRVVNGALAAGVKHAKIFSWQNTDVSGDIIVWLVATSIVTPSTAAANINVGQAAAEIESDDLIDAAALNVAATKNSIIDAGVNGKGAQYVADDEWITGFEDDSAASTALVGEYYIFYTKI